MAEDYALNEPDTSATAAAGVWHSDVPCPARGRPPHPRVRHTEPALAAGVDHRVFRPEERV